MEELDTLDRVLHNKSGIGEFKYTNCIRTSDDKYIYRFFLEDNYFGCAIMVYDDMSEYEVVVQGTGKVYVSLLKDVVSNMYKILVDEYDKYLKDSAYQKYMYNIFEEQVEQYN